jgi:hypothetical protein
MDESTAPVVKNVARSLRRLETTRAGSQLTTRPDVVYLPFASSPAD